MSTNRKLLLQLSAELMFEYRHGAVPADRAIGEYLRARRFLGADDRRFIGDIYYYVLRNLRRIDEAILSAFSSQCIVQDRFPAGFPAGRPMSHPKGTEAWVTGDGRPRELKQTLMDRCIDTIRLAIAAVELKLETQAGVQGEILRCWPNLPNQKPTREDDIVLMFECAINVCAKYLRDDSFNNADIAWSFPTWLWGMMTHNRTIDDAIALARSLSGQAPVTLRINTIIASPEEARAALQEAGLPFTQGKQISTAIHLENRIPRNALPHIEDGWFEVQDEGSQLISAFADPRPGYTVVDACAGGGGKSLHMAALMENDGRIFPFDIEPARLNQLDKRAKTAGVICLDRSLQLNLDATPPAAIKPGTVQLVLVDAPCSGTGTIRRNPEVKWTLSPERLEELRIIQATILDRWADRVAVGGHLVYVTCSLLDAENEYQADAFLKRHRNFDVDPPKNFLVPLTSRGELKLAPHIHGCDGFYAIRLRRVG